MAIVATHAPSGIAVQVEEKLDGRRNVLPQRD
jgi:hypothetical protein